MNLTFYEGTKITVWVCAGVLFYIYVGYPLILSSLARLWPRRDSSRFPGEPSVTLLISAYNEKDVIGSKLENSLALHYAHNRLEIMVVSDDSDDGTDAIVEQHAGAGIKLIRQHPRKGKTAGLNLGVSEASGDILVFSDANALYRPDAVRQLVRHFSDPKVGYVVGNARYREKASDSASAQSEGLYWKLETYLKTKESAFESVVGGDGAIYAIRRELYSPLLPTDINDFLNPLQIIARGYRGIFEPAAVCHEDAAENFAQEYRRKVRIISRSLNALRRAPAVVSPFGNFRHWFLLVSHKVLRWFAPFFMLALFFSSAALWEAPFFRIMLLLQAAFYALAVAGSLWQNNPRSRVMAIPFYFCMVNLASLVGCLKCLRGELSAQWTPPREKAHNDSPLGATPSRS